MCDQCFTQNAHLGIHAGEKPSKCDVCGKAFSHNAHLTVHQRIILERNHIKVIFVAGALLIMKTLEVIRELILERNLTNVTCDKAFSQISGLLIHQRTHTREKSYKYSQCGKAFIAH